MQIRFHSSVFVTGLLSTASSKFYPSVVANERGNDTDKSDDTNGDTVSS